MKQEYEQLTDLNENQIEQMWKFLDRLAGPSVRERIFSIADTLIGGQPVAVSSGGSGGNSDSSLRWDRKRPDNEEEANKRRCIKIALEVSMKNKHSYRRR